MVGRIIDLTTNENDVILDPFSGTGTVLAKANFCKRKYIGLELNKSYIKMFNNYLRNLSQKQRMAYEISKRNRIQQDKFKKLIIDLRILKFAKIMRKMLIGKGISNIKLIYVERLKCKPLKKHKLVTSRYSFLIDEELGIKKLKKNIQNIISIPPLSKYGIEPEFQFFNDYDTFLSIFKNKKLYTYTSQVTHKYHANFKIEYSNKSYKFISPIKLNINENEYV